MSTFEYLRYADTDVTSEAALYQLPAPIVDRLWVVVHEPEEENGVIFSLKCRSLARWAKTAQTTHEKEYVRRKFHRALKEVEPCNDDL